MNIKLKAIISSFILVILLIISSNVFAETGRFVDIPVPPNSAGYTDYTEEEAAEREAEYEENKENELTAEDYVGKSGDYYLKSLNVEGYDLEPEFIRENDTYTIYVKDNTINTFNVTAEADDENAKIDGIGTVTVSSKERFINITVTAENGNIKVYTINVDDEANRKKDYNILTMIIIVIVVLIVIFIISRIFKNKKKSKSTRRH